MLYYTPKFNTPFFCQWTGILKCTERYKSVTHTSLVLRRQQRGNVIQILRENTSLASLNTTLHQNWRMCSTDFIYVSFFKKRSVLLRFNTSFDTFDNLSSDAWFMYQFIILGVGVGIKEAYTCTRLLVYISLLP